MAVVIVVQVAGMVLLWLPFDVEVVMTSCHDECWSLVACCHEEGWCLPFREMLCYITSLVVISFPSLLFPPPRIIWLYCYYPRTSFLTFCSPLLLLVITSLEKSLLSVFPPFSSFFPPPPCISARWFSLRLSTCLLS